MFADAWRDCRVILSTVNPTSLVSVQVFDDRKYSKTAGSSFLGQVAIQLGAGQISINTQTDRTQRPSLTSCLNLTKK